MPSSRRQFLALSGTAATAGCLSAPSDENSPGIRLESVDAAESPGETVPLAPPGKITVLEFFATWCGLCPAQMPPLKKIREKYPASTVAVRSVTAEVNETAVEEYWEKWDATWPALLDENMAAYDEYGVGKLPTTFVIDTEGEVVETKVRTAFERELTAAIEDARGTSDGSSE